MPVSEIVTLKLFFSWKALIFKLLPFGIARMAFVTRFTRIRF
jgi:hypothetical protein